MVNWYTFWGSNSAIFIIAGLLKWSQLLKERICYPVSKFFLFRVYLMLEGFVSKKSKQKLL